MKKQGKKRKKWPAYKYWTEFLMQDKELWVGDNRTINHALAKLIMFRDGREHTEQELDRFAEYLDGGRNNAIKMLWASGNRRYVLGKGRIEAITNNPEDLEEHLSRIGQMLDQKKIATGQKSIGATKEQCKQFGLPERKEIDSSSQRLLLGDCNFDAHIKSIALLNS